MLKYAASFSKEIKILSIFPPLSVPSQPWHFLIETRPDLDGGAGNAICVVTRHFDPTSSQVPSRSRGAVEIGQIFKVRNSKTSSFKAIQTVTDMVT